MRIKKNMIIIMESLTNKEIKEKLNKWLECKTVNPFTERKIKIDGKTYKKLEKMYIDIFDGNFYKNKKISKIDSIVYNIFSNKNFNKSYDLELKNYLRIFIYLEFRTRELYLQYSYIPDLNRNRLEIGQPFKDTRLLFYELVRLNKIPNYLDIIINDNIEQKKYDKITELKILYKSYYELLKEHNFENKYIVNKDNINFEKIYIEEEFKDTKEYFSDVLDRLFEDNFKYYNIKIIHNTLKINFCLLLCDNCGKKSPKIICECGVNVYCNEKCKIKDFKYHYENCKYIITNIL